MAKIQWPLNPSIGDQVSAPRGGAWTWDGCIWKHSCCSGCDIRKTGLNVGFIYTEGFYNNYINSPAPVQVFCLSYKGSNTWSVDIGAPGELSGAFLRVEFSYGLWTLSLVPTDGPPLVIALLAGTDPVGAWQYLLPNGLGIEIVSECGCASAICVQAYGSTGPYGLTDPSQITLFPTYNYAPGSGLTTGGLIGYTGILGLFVFILKLDGVWSIIGGENSNLILANLPSNPDVPVSDAWVELHPSVADIVTLLGPCSCDPMYNGVHLGIKLDAGGGNTATLHLNFLWQSPTSYVSDLGPTLTFTGGTWRFAYDGVTTNATLSSTDPIGVWTDEGGWPMGFPSVLSIVSTCGANIANEGCLTLITGGPVQNIQLVRVTYSGPTYPTEPTNYIDFEGSGFHVWNFISGWEIIDGTNNVIATGSDYFGPWALTPTGVGLGYTYASFDQYCSFQETSGG